MKSNIESQFVPYQQAVELKELGFDEPCLAHLIGFGDGTLENGSYTINHQQVFYPNDNTTSDDKAEELGLYPFVICGVPFYQKAFRWFREKYCLKSGINTANSNWSLWSFNIERKDWTFLFYSGLTERNYFNSYEEAELAALVKLIEIVKNQNLIR